MHSSTQHSPLQPLNSLSGHTLSQIVEGKLFALSFLSHTFELSVD